MNNIFIFTSPLEQFLVLPLFTFFGVAITNGFIISLMMFYFSYHLIYAIFQRCFLITVEVINYFSIVPNKIQSFIEMTYKMIASLINDNIKHTERASFFPLVFFIYLFILGANLIGLVPFSVTITSQLLVTVSFSVATFIGINIIAARKHGKHFFALFVPAGTSPLLALILVPIELISYICKPVSLSIRLFANMMAGHTLLKVIAGFGVVMAGFVGLFAFACLVPVMILIPLFALELAVAVIQAFVFSTLICIYLNDALNLH